MGERLNGIQEVDGSIPFSSTNKIKYLVALAVKVLAARWRIGGVGP